MKRFIAIALVLFSLDAAAVTFRGSGMWVVKNPTDKNCFGTSYKNAVLKDAYSQCRPRYSHETCQAAVNQARELDNFTSQNSSGVWDPWDNKGQYVCNLFVEIYL